MQRIFVGLVFVMLDFSLAIGNCRIGLLPDFVGYLLILRGARRMMPTCSRFAYLLPAAKTLAGYSLVSYVLDLLGLLMRLRLVTYLMGAVALAGMLYLCWLLVPATADLQSLTSQELNVGGLNNAWLVLLIVCLLRQLTLPLVRPGTFFSLVTLGAQIYYLICFEQIGSRWLRQKENE